MFDFEELIKNDTTDDNRYATALTEAVESEKSYLSKITELENKIKEKDNSIVSLKAKNFDLISKVGKSAENPTSEKHKTIEEFTKEILNNGN